MTTVEIIIGILVSMVVTIIVIPQAIKLAFKYDLLDKPGQHKRHKRPVPILGGLVLFVATWSAVLVYIVLNPSLIGSMGVEFLFICAGALIVLLVGMSDDLAPVSAGVKLTAQIGAGLVLYLGGLRVELLTTPWGSVDVGMASVFITVLWVVGLTNAVNLIDGLDGLAGGVCLVAAASMMIIGRLHGVGEILILICALIGFLVPFLYHNKYPARIFLGDSGSMQLGYYFAVFSLVVPVKSFTLTALYLPLLALGVPLLEAGSSTIRRLAAGRNIMQADRRHLFHYLALAGLSPRQVVWVFYGLATVFGIFAVAMNYLNRALVLWLLLLFMVVIFVSFFILLLKLPFRKGQKRPTGRSA